MENRGSKWATNQGLKSFRFSGFIPHHNHESLFQQEGPKCLVLSSITPPRDLRAGDLKMVQRLTYRKRHSYATKSNQHRVVYTPGGKLVYQTTKKRASRFKGSLTWDLVNTRGLDYQGIAGLWIVPMVESCLEVLLGRELSGLSWWRSKRLWRRFWRFRRQRKNRPKNNEVKSFELEDVFEQNFVMINDNQMWSWLLACLILWWLGCVHFTFCQFDFLAYIWIDCQFPCKTNENALSTSL